MSRIVSGLLMIGLLSAPIWAQEKKAELTEKEKKAVAAVEEFLKKINGAGAALSVKNEEAVREQFPDYVFVNARYRLYPVAKRLPEGMRASNVFAVDKEGKVEHFKDAKALEKFFVAAKPAVKDEAAAKTLVNAWLNLSQESHQDGFFTFEIMPKEFTYDGKHAGGKVMAVKGGNGDISAEWVLENGKPTVVAESAKLKPGPRPICQATKLLDPDPLVRRICEQDLLYIGLAGRDYLMEQRELASPELREAIDQLWRQIEKNGW